MRKTFFTLIFVMMISVLSFGQLTGIKTIPGDYSSVSNAIFALNSVGVGPGGVTFSVAGGHTETFPLLTSGLITVTGTAANPILFQRSGAGANPVITGCVTGPNTTDYVFALQGTDYITFDGIDVAEPTGVIEWGYAILKASAQDGSQNVTIKNCNISLKKTNTATVGIYSANVTPGAPVTPLTVDTPNGSNSNNKYYSNNISGCYSGILINGYADPTAPYALYDQSTEIGKDGGNTVTSFGGSTVVDYGIYTSYQNRMTIANNTINGTVDGNGACAGIQMNTANNASTNVYSNTISIAYTGTGAFYGIYNNMGTNFTDNIYNFYSNTVTNCTYANAVSGNFYGIYNYISAATINWNNCQVTNNTYGSGTTTSTGTVAYMYLFGSPTTPASVNFYGNSVTGNLRLQSVVGSGTSYYMYISGGGTAGPVTNVYNNLVDNNTGATSGGAYGFYFLNGASVKNFYNNTFSNQLNTRGTIYGVYTGNGYTTNIYNNKIQNINSIAASALVYGINLSSSTGSGTMNVYNNYVSELKTPNTTTAVAQYGIYGGATSTNYLNIYYNTVYLDGTSAGTGFGSVGLYVGSSPASVDLRNNIIVNNTTPTGAGLAVAFKSGVALATNIGAITNNNDYYAGTPASNHLIFYDGTNSDQTLVAYKARMFPREGNSITENPPFTQVATTPYNLHINAAVATQCESAGQVISTPVSIANDFDNDARFPNSGYPNDPGFPATAPDLGADEFAGMPLDLIPPVISYTLLQNTMSMLDRTLTATITDASGVPVSGDGLPRVCWKKNYNGSWAYATGTSDGNNQYSFSFGAGTILGDTVYYYVVAQDASAAKNVGTFPILGSGGFSANPPTAATPPTNSSKYVIIQGICGTFTVGTGQDFATLTAAINSINIKEFTCPVTLLLTDNVYSSETYPIIINQIQGATSVNTLTIKPAPGATPNFLTSYLGLTPNYWSMISLNGAQHVIIDGSNSGGTDKSLTFQNTAVSGFAAAIGLYNNGTIGAGNITIKNCVVRAHTDNVYNA